MREHGQVVFSLWPAPQSLSSRYHSYQLSQFIVYLMIFGTFLKTPVPGTKRLSDVITKVSF